MTLQIMIQETLIPELNEAKIGFAETNSEIQTLNTNDIRDESDSPQDLEQLKSTIKAWASDPVTVTADGELKEILVTGQYGLMVNLENLPWARPSLDQEYWMKNLFT